MIDTALDWLVVTLLVIPMAIPLAMTARRWIRAAWDVGRRLDDREQDGEAEIEAMGFELEGDHHRLRLKNAGDRAARDVRVYVNNKPITVHRGSARAEEYPIEILRSGSTTSFRYASDGEGVIVRTEWDDPSGGGTWEAAMAVS